MILEPNVCVMQEDHDEAIQRELGVEFAKDDEEDEEEHPGASIFMGLGNA